MEQRFQLGLTPGNNDCVKTKKKSAQSRDQSSAQQRGVYFERTVRDTFGFDTFQWHDGWKYIGGAHDLMASMELTLVGRQDIN